MSEDKKESKNEAKKESKLELDPNFVERMSDNSGMRIIKNNPKK